MAAGDIDEGTGQIADHFVEESFAVVFDVPGILNVDWADDGTGSYGDRVDIADRRLGFGARAAESREVVFADEGLGEFSDAIRVEIPADVPGVALRKRIGVSMLSDGVGVAFSRGGEGGVEVFGSGFDRFDSDIWLKDFVESALEFFEGEVGGPSAVEDLSQSVNAGVGASCTGDFDGRAAEFFEGGFNGFLDGGGVGLDLPSGEVGAVVTDDGFDVVGFGHGRIRADWGWATQIEIDTVAGCPYDLRRTCP